MDFLKITALGLAIFSVANVSQAAPFRQQIKVCVAVPINSNHSFDVYFASTDFFDLAGHIRAVTSGVGCADHTYEEGPKNLTVQLFADRHFVTLDPDTSCFNLGFKQGTSAFITLDTGTGFPHHYWSFILAKTDKPGNFKVSCKTQVF